MKISLALDIDLTTGSYDLQVGSPSHPGANLDAHTLRTVVGRVMDNMVVRQLAQTDIQSRRRPEPLLN